jgi:hypothetical protein
LMHWMIPETKEILKMTLASFARLCALLVEPSNCYFKTRKIVDFGIILLAAYCLITG